METEKLLKPSYFYDKDFITLKNIYNDFRKKFSHELDVMQTRIDRCKTLEISTSVFDYSNRLEQVKTSPEFFYNFSFLDVNIFIFCPIKKHYSILIKGTDITSFPVSRIMFESDLPKDFTSNEDYSGIYSWRLVKASEDLDTIVEIWRKLIKEYLSTKDLENELF